MNSCMIIYARLISIEFQRSSKGAGLLSYLRLINTLLVQHASPERRCYRSIVPGAASTGTKRTSDQRHHVGGGGREFGCGCSGGWRWRRRGRWRWWWRWWWRGWRRRGGGPGAARALVQAALRGAARARPLRRLGGQTSRLAGDGDGQVLPARVGGRGRAGGGARPVPHPGHVPARAARPLPRAAHRLARIWMVVGPGSKNGQYYI